MEPVSGGNGELSRAPNNWPRATAAVISRCKGAMKTLEFDPTEVDGDDLLNLALEIFLEVNVHEGLGIETEKLKRFILAVHDRMLDNPYHNWVRAFDALQTSYALLCLSKQRQRLTEAEVLGLLIAALCYDLEHPGVNSQFLVKSKSSLATLYNNDSFLEKHHAFRAFELMLHPSVDLLAAVPKDQYVSFRHLVMTLILSTDMARHEEFVLQLNKSSDGGGGLDSLLYMELILKCADMADPMKPFPVFAKWAVRMTDELFLQGDMERASGMEVSAVCDRTCQSRVAVIKGIVDYIVEPFCRLLGRALPALSASFERIPVNRALWDPYDDAKLLQEAGKKDNAQISPLSLRVASWNIAAVNNNPFEYWVTHGQTYQSEGYAKLMTDVQTLIDAPGSRDFKVCEVITDDMMGEVIQALTGHGCNGVEDLMHVWRTEYKERYAISGFLKDKAIGSKRLISMPDRISNTINSEGLVLMRPSVISMFNDVGMKTTAGWWALWKQYMFHTQVKIIDRNKPNHFNYLFVVGMLQNIARSKYPAISEKEEKMSIPLQVMALAIFDGVLLHILNMLAPATWQPIKVSLCEAFNQNKGQKVISILERSYANFDVIFIQEAAAAFVEAAKQGLGRKYMILRPYLLDGFRNQNSIILAKRAVFVEGATIDVTEHVIGLAGGGKWTAAGDLCAMNLQGVDGNRYFLASFHGDTNGMASLPVLRALDHATKTYYPNHILICGMDANTHKIHSESTQGLENFHHSFLELGMMSCWGHSPSLATWTTRNARTYLQPQLQKAVGIADVARKGDMNLKDWIVFHSSQSQSSEEQRDNTGDREFREDMVFPTLAFPSDHCIVSARITRRADGAGLPMPPQAAPASISD